MEEDKPASGTVRGTFIVIEGLDRAGKTTQAQRLATRLKAEGKRVELMRFPDRTSPIGQIINTYLRGQTTTSDQAIHLLFSANRWESADTIISHISNGTTVIADRYIHSGMVYSAAKQNPTLSLEWARTPDIGLPKPDVVVFLDLEPEEARKRGGFGEEVYEKEEMQRRVRELFLRVKEDGRERIVAIDAGGSLEEVEEGIWRSVEGLVRNIEAGATGATLGVVEELR